MSRRVLIAVFLIAGLSLLLTERSFRPLRALVGTGIYPISRPLTQLTQSVRSILATTHEIRSLTATVQALRATATELRAQVAELDAVRHENEQLKLALNFQRDHGDQTLIPARVVGRSPSRFLESLEVDKGSADGVQAAAPVIADGFLVGVVQQRSTHRATIRLVTASDSTIAVVFARSRAQGLLRGGLAGLVASKVPLDVHVEPGEPAVTSSLGGLLPANIPIGQARDSRALPADILQEIGIDTPVNSAKLELVFIGTPIEQP